MVNCSRLVNQNSDEGQPERVNTKATLRVADDVKDINRWESRLLGRL